MEIVFTGCELGDNKTLSVSSRFYERYIAGKLHNLRRKSAMMSSHLLNVYHEQLVFTSGDRVWNKMPSRSISTP